MVLGRIIAEAAMSLGKNVTWMPSYGAEVRGGTAYSMVVISDDEIASPVVDNADFFIIMNAPSFDKFKKTAVKGSAIILNSSLAETNEKIKGIKIIKIPATEIAISLGKAMVANTVMFGCFARLSGLIDKEKVMKLLKDALAQKQHLFEINKNAFSEGYDFIPANRQNHRLPGLCPVSNPTHGPRGGRIK